MFSHEGPALELLMLIFGLSAVVLVVWFLHHRSEQKAKKDVGKQEKGGKAHSS